MNLVPAYGRDYKSKKALEEDFNADKDFKICDVSSQWNGAYINKSQLLEIGIGQVTVRYKKLASVTMVKVK